VDKIKAAAGTVKNLASLLDLAIFRSGTIASRCTAC
jgi:hypothetical protein